MRYEDIVFFVVSGAGRLFHDRPLAAYPSTGEVKETLASFEQVRELDGGRSYR